MVDRLRDKVPRMQKIAADHGYKESFIEHVAEQTDWEVELVQRPKSTKGFVPKKNCRPMERIYGWMKFRRRLCRDYEKTTESSETMIRIATISLLVNRLAI